MLRIYHGASLKHEKDIPCAGTILAVEFIIERNSICVSLSNRTFIFFDASSNTSTPYKPGPTFLLPSTQNCLCYVPRKNILFSAGTDGTVFAWQIDKILHNDYSEASAEKGVKNSEKERVEYRNFTTAGTPWFIARFGFASCIVDLPNIEQIATGSYKNLIELWELRNDDQEEALELDHKKGAGIGKNKKTGRAGGKAKAIGGSEPFDEVAKQPTKKLEGHKKAIREIAYSKQYKILVSVGFDFQVFVWNPYSFKEIIKLDGHESPLVGVNCPAGLECFITCDTKGMINVWDIRDYSCLQTLNVTNVIQVTSMRVVPKHRRLVIGSRVFKVFEYKKPFNPDTSDDNPILCALFSSIRFEFYIAGERSVNVWNAKNGKPTRCFKNCFESDITCMALDKEHRKLIVGSHVGEIKVFDLLSGVMINQLERHGGKGKNKGGADESAEISFIGYGDEDLTIITTAWDKTIKIHKDDRDEQKQKRPQENVLRAKSCCHKRDIISGDYSHNLGLIATGGRDYNVRIWEYEKMKFLIDIKAHEDEVTTVKFLNPLPLLLTADSKGVIFIWQLDEPYERGECLIKMENTHSMGVSVPVSAVDSFYDEEKEELLLLIGDEKGRVKPWDISIIPKERGLKPRDCSKDIKRNPHRPLALEEHTLDRGHGDGDALSDVGAERDKAEPAIDQGQIKQLFTWEKEAHSDVIRAIQYINATDVPLVFTAGIDKMACIWGLDGAPKGRLTQGYMMKANYFWDFPLNQHEQSNGAR